MGLGRRLTAITTLVVCSLAPRLASGQSSEKEPIVTDRPDFTEAAVVVPKGSLQFENGIAWTDDHGARKLDLTESLVRLGIGSRTEIRFGVPGFLANFGPHGAEGFGDFSIGLKQQIGPLPGGFDLSLIGAISLPVGEEAESSHGYDPFLKLPWSRELGHGWSTGGMFSVFWFTEDNHRRFMWEPTIYIERQLSQSWDAFFEYGSDFPDNSTSRQTLHAGVAWRVRPRHQVDLHGGVGVSDAAPQRFIAAGYSFRFDHVLFRKKH